MACSAAVHVAAGHSPSGAQESQAEIYAQPSSDAAFPVNAFLTKSSSALRATVENSILTPRCKNQNRRSTCWLPRRMAPRPIPFSHNAPQSTAIRERARQLAVDRSGPARSARPLALAPLR